MAKRRKEDRNKKYEHESEKEMSNNDFFSKLMEKLGERCDNIDSRISSQEEKLNAFGNQIKERFTNLEKKLEKDKEAEAKKLEALERRVVILEEEKNKKNQKDD